MPHLTQQSYGKSHVRVTKVDRDGNVHHVSELSVDVQLDGDFTASYTAADNRLVVPTDTMKNTVYVLARQLDVRQLENFSWELACHFIRQYQHVTRASISVTRRPWKRVRSDGEPHPHVFLGCNNERETCSAVAGRTRNGVPTAGVSCGLAGLALLKSTASGFSDFFRDEYTTLADTDDRILATTVEATWLYEQMPIDPAEARSRIREALIAAFGASFSPSVQATLFEMASAALDAVAELESISLAMPNQHRLLVDLAPFGLENPQVVFMPTEEPFGDIRAHVSRDEI
jgi:urate oxidase